MSHSQRKPRGQAEVVIFGRRTVREALEMESVEVQAVRIGQAVPAKPRQSLERACKTAGVETEIVPMRAVGEWSHEPKHDQGVAARVRLKRVNAVEDFAAQVFDGDKKRPSRVLAIDAITNPQNIGMLVRSAAAFGFDAILWPTQGVPWIEGLVVKASAGTVLSATIATCRTTAEGIVALQAKGFKAYGLEAQGAHDLRTFDQPHRLALVLGGENEGISPAVQGVLDGTVRIGIAPGVESLNVAAAAAVVCYALGEPNPSSSGRKGTA